MQQKLNHLSKRILNSFAHFVSFFNNNFKLNIHSEIEDNDGNLLAIDITVEEIQATIIKFTVKILTILVFTKKVRDIYQT